MILTVPQALVFVGVLLGTWLMVVLLLESIQSGVKNALLVVACLSGVIVGAAGVIALSFWIATVVA